MTLLNTRSNFIALVMTLLSFSLSAQIKVATNKDKSVFSLGENMAFRVTGGAGAAQYSLFYNSRDDNSVFQTGTINLNGGTVDIPYTTNTPGAVYCKVQSNSGTDEGVALFDPLNIRPYDSEPSDFDAFWQNQKSKLAAVPIDAQLSPIATQGDGSQSFQISMATVDGRRVYGYITIPSGSGPFPAIITLPSFGSTPIQLEELTNYGLATQGKAISLTISVHNAPINSVDPNAYQPDIITDPAKYYNRLMILATLRCVDYLNSRSDFNGDIGVSGISQGGGLALSLSGLSSQVKALALSVPAACEHAGRRYHRASGFPYFMEQAYNLNLDTNAVASASRYHDAATFAKRFKGPIQADLGYKDEVTYIATQYDAIMAHPGSTIIFNKRDNGHDTPWIEYWQARFAFFKKYLRGFANPITNLPSFVISAGSDQQVNTNSVSLSGTITLNDAVDLYSPVQWDKVSGPGTVTFSQQYSKTTTAGFSAAGTYVLRFSATNDYLIATEGKYVSMANYVTIIVGGSTPVCKNDTTRINAYTCNAASAGIAIVVLKNISGCDSLVVTTTNYQPATVPTITRSGNTLTSSSANTYQWYKDGLAILGATFSNYLVLANGTYSVQAGNAFFCKAVSASIAINFAPTFDCPGLQKNIGDACDDGNPNTINDRVRTGCICQGDAVVVSNAITMNCPKDITVYTSPGANSSGVQWANPTATTTCTVGTTSNNCVTTTIPGFTSLGKFGNSQYFVSTDKKNWDSANAFCKSKGGYLVVINSKEENDFIFSKQPSHGEAYHLGFSNITDGNFRWVNGDSVSYANWDGGFPSYLYAGDNYVVMLGWSGGKWENVNQFVEKPFFMEIDCGNSSTVGAVNLTQTSGPANTSAVNVGTYKITYDAVDNCGNKNTCGFTLTVAPSVIGGGGNGTISNLEVDHSNGKTKIQWVTNAATPNGQVLLQRSFDGAGFQTVQSEIYSNPAHALNAYGFEDLVDKDGEVYYRVLLQMGDGTVQISDIKNVHAVINKNAVVFPNPTSGDFNIQLKAYEKSSVELIISNMLGQEMYRENIDAVQSPIKTISSESLNLKSGFYILNIISKNQPHTYPFVVQK